jgi:hypothetical protein
MKIGEFEYMRDRDRDRAPIGRHVLSFVIADILRGHYRAAVADDDHSWIDNVVGGVIHQPNPKRLEGLAGQLRVQKICTIPMAASTRTLLLGTR